MSRSYEDILDCIFVGKSILVNQKYSRQRWNDQCFSFRRYSRVLVYDWSEPGDAEVVVEDIENLNMDNIDYYDDQQCDWRFYNEEGASIVRYK